MKKVCFLITISSLFISSVSSHPVSLNWVNMKIEQGKISIQYKILVEDLVYFHRPQPDDLYNYSSDTLRSLASKHGGLITNNFKLFDSDQIPLKANLIAINDRSIDSDKINVMDLMRYEIIYYFEYQGLPKDWTNLFIQQKMGKGSIKIPVVTFLSAEENGRVLLEYSELDDNSQFELLRYGRNIIDNPSELTSSYFTATNSGIRHELTIPITILNGLMGQASDNEITDTQLSNYFSVNNKVQVENSVLTPSINEFKSLIINNKNKFIYLDISYSSIMFPDILLIEWMDYSWQFRWLESNIIIEDSVYRHTFSRFQPAFQWSSTLQPEKN